MQAWPIKKIVYATDFSDEGKPALRHTINLARLLDAAVEVIHVREPFPYAQLAGFGGVPKQQLEELHSWVEARMEEVVAEVAAAGLPYKAKSLDGNAATEIVKHATELKADVIVLGTHGRTGLDHALLGSVAEKVVRQAPCPVFVVPAKDTK